MGKFRITPQAKQDLKGIGRYTERNWGKQQRNLYLKQLEKRFIWLAENPALGAARGDIKQGYFCFPQGQHLIFYLVHSDGIDIIGVPHKEMDVPSVFLRQ